MTVEDIQGALDYPMTSKEIQHKLKTLKNGKACSIDSINSEMLKHSNLKLQPAVQKHFNLVLAAGNDPSVWNKGLISPRFKSGDKYNPSNYRGNLSKLFCSILNFQINHHIISLIIVFCLEAKLAFYPVIKHLTTSTLSIHSSKSMFTKKHKGKMFACLVDLKQAFDTIWHNGLFLQLLQNGIGGKIYDLIKSTFSDNQCCVKIGNKRTEFFKQGKGCIRGATCLLLCSTFISINWPLFLNSPQAQDQIYKAKKSNSSCMQMTWFYCAQQNMVYSRTSLCWRRSVRTGR